MATQLLNNDGSASMATLLMCSHHAFRRDVGCFAKALRDPARPVDVLATEWTHLRNALHGHHTVEDTAMFPDLRGKHPEIAATLDELAGHHRAIDPLLERGDVLFASLATQRAAAGDLISTLSELLGKHLDLEERTITPHLRDAKQFPVPPGDEMLAMYADGFAWSGGGVATAVLDQVNTMLPPALAAKIPAARETFDERCRRVWGYTHTGASRTSVPA